MKKRNNVSFLARAAMAAGASIATLVPLAAIAADAPTADLVNRKQLRVCADPADLHVFDAASENRIDP